MIDTSDGYRKAIISDARRILIQAIIDIIDPDISFGTVGASSQNAYSRPQQLHNKNLSSPTKYATLEKDRFLMDGSFLLFPDNPNDQKGEVGFLSENTGDKDGYLNEWVELRFSNVSILQACSVYFSENESDGVPADFTVEVKQGGVTYFSKSFTGNAEPSVSMIGFTVYDPDAIRITVSKWSIGNRRLRLVEIIPGVYERWNGDIIAEFSMKHQGDVSCMSLPYGTCTVKMDNLDRRFEPRSKNGLFQSLEERQGIDVSLAVRLDEGGDEYKRVGIFYQYSGGWKTGDNGLTMQWDLVDIVGLLAGREFIPGALPTTLQGWAAALVSQLGSNFANKYTVDPSYANLPVSVREASDVVGMKCGDIIRYVCMATGTWPRADAETGNLAFEPLWNQGNKLTLDNLASYPTMKANPDIAAIIFTLNDGNKTQYVVSGNSSASSETQSVNNPFIQTSQQALTAARLILSSYGGNQYEITGRGDMSSEIGDVDTLWLNESTATTARRIQQDLSFSGGVLKDCSSTLLQADGSFLFQNRIVITKSGMWSAPSGATSLRIILVGRGNDGAEGQDGTWDESGEDGADGAGAKVFAQTIKINPQQSFSVSISSNTVFGSYSSANGVVFPLGYTDIASGDSFARSGVEAPVDGTGDGGKGGKGGAQGRVHEQEDKDGITHEIVDSYPEPGKPGKSGAYGCAVVYWDKESL